MSLKSFTTDRTFNRPDVLITVPTFGNFDYARRCCESIVRASPHLDIVIALIDDASPEWPSVDWNDWPAARYIRAHFDTRGGLTRSWNYGLRLARELGATFSVCGNSDLLFTPGWFHPLATAVKNEGYSLVGPVTNTPGHCPWQNVKQYASHIPISDSYERLDALAKYLLCARHPLVPATRINGFCLFSSTTNWWNGAFDDQHVFNPAYKLTGNEDELQQRWLADDKNIAFSPRSYVFHYRSVSRPEALKKPESKGAYRPGTGVIR